MFDQECNYRFLAVIDQTNPYASGSEVTNGTADPTSDLAFKTFVQ